MRRAGISGASMPGVKSRAERSHLLKPHKMEPVSTDLPTIPQLRLEKERDFAAILYVLQSVIKRTSPITEMVSHDILFEYLSVGEPDPECPKMKYSYLATPSGYDDAGINDLLGRAQRIISETMERIWGELVQYEEQSRNK